MLYSNARELVLPEQAEQYWSIKPEELANVVSIEVAQ
jgi:hypothetical protein